MENDPLKQTEKVLKRIFLVLAVISVAGVILLIRFGGKESNTPVPVKEEAKESDSEWDKGLSDATYWMPENCSYYDVIPEITFKDGEGNNYSIRDFEGKPVVLVFWASWCEDCKEQMPKMAAYKKLAEAYGPVSFVFVNKTDGNKETLESAAAYFEALNLEEPCYYDTSLKAYETLGIHNIPTTLFLDKSGRILSMSPSQIKDEGGFEALLANMVNGSSKATADFIVNGLMDDKGGVHSSYQVSIAPDEKTEVLSESQGLLLLYASNAADRKLFDQVLAYVKEMMWKEGLAAWKVENSQSSDVNALIDDFRIYRSLVKAQELWGEYDEELSYVIKVLKDFGIKDEQYVDFYDNSNKKYADRLTLCYIDLKAMELLGSKDEVYNTAFENAQEILEQGQISDSFPLYYSYFNYGKTQYEKDDLNMAEAMVSLLHLAEQGKLKNNTVKWLKNQMAGEGIKARYTVEGKAVKGYNYDSTAVYALVAMIGEEIEDSTLRGQALKKMEKMHITDTALSYNGAFGLEDGTGITSFDQLMPLLAYQKLENRYYAK